MQIDTNINIKITGPRGENLGVAGKLKDLLSIWKKFTPLCSRFPEFTPTSCVVMFPDFDNIFKTTMLDCLDAVLP